MTIVNKEIIHILVATYNGEEFIAEQLNSILNQSYKNIIITIRDDGSKDNTIEIIKRIQEKNADVEILLVKNTTNQQGHLHNFSALAELALTSKAQYFCFCDQDDIWHKDKLSIQLERLIHLENKNNKKMPLLIHSDLQVVDSKLNKISNSFVKYQGLPDPKHHHFPEFLYQNVVTGCACIFNKALLNIACPIPKCAPVHDWWFALCAESFGMVDYIDKSLVSYRQHGKNSIGSTNINEQRYIFKKFVYKIILRYPKHISISIEQSQSLMALEQSQIKLMMPDKNQLVKEFASLKKIGFIKRINYADKLFKGKRTKLELSFLYIVFIIMKWL